MQLAANHARVDVRRSGLILFRSRLCRALVSTVVLVAGTAACGGGGSNNGQPMPVISMSGTAATGQAISNAAVSIVCARGSTSTTTDSSGHFAVSFMATTPCLLTVTSGATVLHSVAFAGGTFNVTPETELLLDYVSAQIGTNVAGLIAGLSSSAAIDQVLGNAGTIESGETAVVHILNANDQVVLTTNEFLTQSFSVGQAGEDADLETLKTAGAIDSNGMPSPPATTAMTSAGSANPIKSATGISTGGGGSGGQSGGVGGMGGGMM